MDRFDFTMPGENEQMPPYCNGCGMEPWRCDCAHKEEQEEMSLFVSDSWERFYE